MSRASTAWSLALLLGLGAVPSRALAQDQPPLDQIQQPPQGQAVRPEGEERAPAYIASLDGDARLDREGRSDAAERGVPLVPGDRLRTEAGRLELAFPNGSQVYLDRYGELELLDPLVVRLARGRLYVRLQSTIEAAERLLVETPGASVEFGDDGEYRIAVGGTEAVEVELGVLRGAAAISSAGGSVEVLQGHRAFVREGAAPTEPEWFNASQTPLEKWAAEREAMWQSGMYASRQYLPSELAPYAATFDQNGSWQNDDTYGAVWYPSGTSEDWRPYHDGRWDYTSTYGYTWIASGPVWAYPTHHYGRWHTGPRGWFWIPSRRWGSAWVYWAVAPDYIGWCPLGWNGRPVVNPLHADRVRGPRWRDSGHAWTVMARNAFGSRTTGRAAYIDRARLGRDQPAFVLQHRPPGFAPARSPSPFNARLNPGATASGSYSGSSVPSRGTVSTTSPRSYGRHGSTDDQRGGHAAPRDAGAGDDAYQRAQPYMARPAPRGSDTSGSVYRRVPSGTSPVRSPGAWRSGGDSNRDGDGDDGRGGPGYASPGYRSPGSPGMSRPMDGSWRRPGMSDDGAGERRAAPRYQPPSRSDDDGGRDRGGFTRSAPSRGDSDSRGDDDGARGGARTRGDSGSSRGDSGSSRGDNGSSRGDSGSRGMSSPSRSGDSGSSRGSSGGAVRRHP